MADALETNAKIDSLRAKVDADPKSRHFYPLAEELRKVGRPEEAEAVLRAGLEHHSTYLSGWLGLGRILKDRGAYGEAVDVLMRGLSLDPENVVAAKLLANTYLAMGDKVEAIKKFKLVSAQMPTDEEAEQQIAILDREINLQNDADLQQDASVPEPRGAGLMSEEEASPLPSPPVSEASAPGKFDLTNPDPFTLESALPDVGSEPLPELADEAVPFSGLELPEHREGDEANAESPPAAHDAVVEVEGRKRAPSSEDIWSQEDESSGELPASAETVTMAQILAQQGDLGRARETYERVLERDPGNVEAMEGLSRLPGGNAPDERVNRLEAWRRKVVGS